MLVLISLWAAPPAAQAQTEPADSESRSHIPSWLQARWGETPLYSLADGKQVMARVSQWTFLRVLEAGDYRLKVETVGDRPTRAGWVEPFDVQPAEPGEGWMQPSESVDLLADAHPSAAVVGELGPD